MAKYLLRDAEANCSDQFDDFSFTKGVLNLHDAVEAAFGAVADHLNAHIKAGNQYLIDYADLIEKADPANRPIPLRTQLKVLNTLRNNAKHQGLLATAKLHPNLVGTISGLLEHLSDTYLGQPLDSISLKSAIRDFEARMEVELAESRMISGNIEESLASCARAMSRLLSLYVHTPQPQIISQGETSDIERAVKMLQVGIDLKRFGRFVNLTPHVTQNGGQTQLVWGKDYGHEDNWTQPNARFCIDFCVDAAIKLQREDEDLGLIHFGESFEDVIEATADNVTVWRPDYSRSGVVRVFAGENDVVPYNTEIVRTLRRGEVIRGIAYTRGPFDDICILSTELPSAEEGKAGLGFVSARSITISRKRKDRTIPVAS